MKSPRPRSHPDELLRKANIALEQEEFAEAEALARRAMMVRPDSYEARGVLSSALIELGAYEEAGFYLDQMLREEPDDLPALADMGLCLFEVCEFEAAETVLRRALEIEPTDPQACYWLALCLERRGQHELADRYFLSAHDTDPESYPRPLRVSREVFTGSVAEALSELPDEISSQLENVSILVEELPREADLVGFDPPLDPCLYGLYVGVPLPERSNSDPPELPDTIYIYQRNLERFCPDRASLVREIRITLLHEIGHYLGFDEEELAKRGLA